MGRTPRETLSSLGRGRVSPVDPTATTSKTSQPGSCRVHPALHRKLQFGIEIAATLRHKLSRELLWPPLRRCMQGHTHHLQNLWEHSLGHTA
jgi:hypothetical protein